MAEYTDVKNRTYRIVQRVLDIGDRKDTEEEIVEALYRLFNRK